MAIAIVLVLLVVGTVLFHIFNPWWFTPIASNWQMIDDTVDLTVWVTGLVFIAINLFVALAVFRFRHREGSKAAYEPENKKLEWWLTIFTTVGIIALLAPGLFVWAKFVAVPQDAVEVEVVGQQWNWSYRFPGPDGTFGATDANFFSSDNPFGMDPDDPAGQDDLLVPGNELHLPVDTPIKVLARSKDVLHNFAVPQFRVKMDMVPGMVTHFWFTPTATGSYDVLCMELCGIGHYLMRARVVVDEQQDFDQWLADRSSFAEEQVNRQQLADAGKTHYTTCVTCHGEQGHGKPEMNGPQIAGLDRDYIARQLRHFRSGRRGSDPSDSFGQQMAAMSQVLPDEQAIESVSAYVASLPPKAVPEGAAGVAGNASRGESLYRNCAACHGDNGQGIWSMGAPRLTGMRSDYISRQLQHFRQGLRGSDYDDQYGRQMAAMASILTDEQAVADVIAYINTLELPGQRQTSNQTAQAGAE